MRRVLLAALLALLALAVWWWPVADSVGVAPGPAARPAAPPEPPRVPARKRPFVATAENSRQALRTDDGTCILPEIAEQARQLHTATATAEEDLEILQGLIAFYRRSNGGANPGGGLNVEIVSELRGRNPNRLAVLPADLPAFNAEGELLDRWGTPYFFHPISRTTIEIRTAGPDRKLWTDDDIESQSAPDEVREWLTRN